MKLSVFIGHLHLAICLGGLASSLGAADGPAEWKLTPATAKYCHIVHFFQAEKLPTDVWDMPGDADLQFRATERPTVFLVKAVTETSTGADGFVISDDAGLSDYSRKTFLIDLADPSAVARPADEKAWKAAKVIPLFRRNTFGFTSEDPRLLAEYNGRSFQKIGRFWEGTRLSPNGARLVLQSSAGKSDQHAEQYFLVRGSKYHGKLYLEFFDTNTGEKILTIEGHYQRGLPGTGVLHSAWLTDRFFIVPVGEYSERCLVCDFGGINGGVQK